PPTRPTIVPYTPLFRSEENTMASNRLGRINEEIQRELSALIPTVKDPRVTGLIFVTRVETTPDLHFAKVYVSVLDKTEVAGVMKDRKSTRLNSSHVSIS